MTQTSIKKSKTACHDCGASTKTRSATLDDAPGRIGGQVARWRRCPRCGATACRAGHPIDPKEVRWAVYALDVSRQQFIPPAHRHSTGPVTVDEFGGWWEEKKAPVCREEECASQDEVWAYLSTQLLSKDPRQLKQIHGLLVEKVGTLRPRSNVSSWQDVILYDLVPAVGSLVWDLERQEARAAEDEALAAELAAARTEKKAELTVVDHYGDLAEWRLNEILNGLEI